MHDSDFEKLKTRMLMEEILRLGAEVSRWAAVNTGRLQRTLHLASECYEKGLISRDHIYAFQELCEIIELYRLWKQRVHGYSGLLQKMRTALKKGPPIREDETKNSSHARNNLFTYYLAGRLLRSGNNVVVIDGCGLPAMNRGVPKDITILLDDCYVDIECKRPSNERTFERNLWDACGQISDSSRGNLCIVALDCSPCVPPIGKEGDEFAKKLSGGDSNEMLGRYLLEKIPRNLSRELPQNIIGLFIFIRLASFSAVVMKESVSGLDRPVAYFTPADRTQLMVYPNVNAPRVDRFYAVLR